MQADKTASLNERERLKERQEADARQKARDQERAARKAADMKIYELTVEKAGTRPPATGRGNQPATANSLPAGTNSTQTASTKVADAAKPPDPMLDETERILEDYISLLSSKQILVAN